MKRPVTSLLPLALLVVLAAITLWLEQAVQAPPPGKAAAIRHDPDLMIENFTTVRHDTRGLPTYSLAARKMVHYSDNELTHLEAPYIISFSPSAPPTHIAADQADLAKDGNEAFFYGNVVISRAADKTQPALRATTERLRINQTADTAHTDDAVRIVHGTSVLSGVGMDADNKNRTFFLRSQTRGTFVRNQ